MVVFEKSPDSGATARVLAHQDAIDTALAEPVRLHALAPYLGMPLEKWRGRFNSHLDHPPNRLALFQLLSRRPGCRDAGRSGRLAGAAPCRGVRSLDTGVSARSADLPPASTWYQAQPYADLLEYQGVPLGPGLEYETLQALMRVALANDQDGDDHA